MRRRFTGRFASELWRHPRRSDTPLMMAALTVLSLVGLVLYWLIYLLEKLVMRWDVPELE